MRGYISWIAGLRSPPFDDAVEGMDNPMADPFSVVTRDGQLVAAVSFRSQPVPGTVIVRRVMYDPDCDIGELVGAMVPLLAQSLRDFWARFFKLADDAPEEGKGGGGSAGQPHVSY